MMIYFDNAATSLRRPPRVAAAMQEALERFGNPGRSFCEPAMEAARAVFAARQAIARLVGGVDPLRVAFTSGVTESLNLAINSLIAPGDHVITTVLEHNSVLRPLYLRGCGLSLLDCDEEGALRLDLLPSLLRLNTRALICTHGSNLLGSVTDLAALRAFCRDHGLLLILDAAQTLGCRPLSAGEADVICFTGHKGLMGPQGTGGLILSGDLPLRLVKTGGSGSHSFAPHQPLEMPDILEAGTPNSHGLAGLCAGAGFIAETGVETIAAREGALTDRFLRGLAAIPGARIYGPPAGRDRLAVVAFNLGGLPADEVAFALWQEGGIASRAGSHCAPLVHRRFGTEKQGMVRFSFGWYNTEEEVDVALDALAQIARRKGDG